MRIPAEVRPLHFFLPGMSGYGKSTTIHAMAYQDIKLGRGVCVIDPKGDLVNQLIHWIPENRVEDTIYLDLDTPIPIDFMRHTDQDKEVLVGDLIYILEKNTANKQRMTAILRDLIVTLLGVPDTTFLDIYYFLVNKRRRDEILLKLRDQDLKDRWRDRFPGEKEIDPILSRMTTIIRTDSLRAIFGMPNAKLNIEDCMNSRNSRKIILVNLGGIGESRHIYGSLLVTKIQQAAFKRHSQKDSERVPFFLYVDEFQNFQTSSFNQILLMARGYKLYLHLASPTIYELDDKVRSAIFSAVTNYIVFCVSADDTKHFRAIAKPYDHEQLASLPRHYALYKIGNAPAEIRRTPQPPPFKETSFAEIIRKRTIEHYSCAVPKNKLVSPEEERITGSPRRFTRQDGQDAHRSPPDNPGTVS
ncbi:MAG TPA: DUF87 domain-containing protein [Candidatus Sulfotelmatobacter sp.]|nr:DUF87 domain-containing protein [Candidatus Sulfotelmatobacter sp.]